MLGTRPWLWRRDLLNSHLWQLQPRTYEFTKQLLAKH